jgi:Zn-dependent peptidase ImmA (M78 family)
MMNNSISQLVIEKSKTLSKELIRQKGCQPPFTALNYANLMGIKKITYSDIGEADGMLLKGFAGPIIKINSKHNNNRQNFSLAHELGHLLIDNILAGESPNKVEFRSSTRSNDIERLCNISATELLMPEAIFSEYMITIGSSIYSISKLSEIFKVSLRAVLIRVAELSKKTRVGLCWRHWTNNKSENLTLEWCTKPNNAESKYSYRPIKQTIEVRDSTFRAYVTDEVIQTRKAFYLNNYTKKMCIMESKGYGLKENRRVLSLATIE